MYPLDLTLQQFSIPFFQLEICDFQLHLVLYHLQILIQNILQSRHQIVFKYDVYDPNTQVKGMDIGVTGSKTSVADIKYSTLGIGYILKIDANTKIMFYGDFVKNEKTSIKETKDSKGNVTDPGYLTDRKDNVFTVRLQYKF